MVFLEQYLELTNSKRIKRTPDEVERGLDAEAVAKERLEAHGKEIGKKAEEPKISAKKPKGPGDKGILTIKPNHKVDADYCEKNFELEISLDNQWYAWFNTRLASPYNGNAALLLQHILEFGLGEVITQMVSEERLNDHLESTAKYTEGTPQWCGTGLESRGGSSS